MIQSERHLRDPIFQEVSLTTACHSNNLGLVMILMSKGADVNENSVFEGTPLMAASRRGHTEIMELLLTKSLLSLNAKGHAGNTALHWAVLYDQPAAISTLMKFKANISVQNSDGNTPLMLAASRGYAGCFTKLISSINDIDIKNKQGQDLAAIVSSKDNPQLTEAFNDGRALAQVGNSFMDRLQNNSSRGI